MKRIFILCLLGAALFTLACKSHYCLTFTLVDGAPNILTFCNLTWTDCKSCLTTKCILKVKILFSFTNLADINLENESPRQPPRQAFAWNGSASFSLNTSFSGGNEESKERRLEEGSSSFRPVRSAAAHPGRSGKKMEKQKERRRRKAKKGLKENENKKRKNVKQRNGKKVKAEKGRKGKGGNGRNRKNTEKRNSKKGKSNKRKKDTKKRNRKRKNKKEKKGNKAKRLFVNREEETTTCGTNVTSALACHDAAVAYMKLLSGKVPHISISFIVDIFSSLFLFQKVANFVKQKKRISSSAKQAASKSSKCAFQHNLEFNPPNTRQLQANSQSLALWSARWERREEGTRATWPATEPPGRARTTSRLSWPSWRCARRTSRLPATPGCPPTTRPWPQSARCTWRHSLTWRSRRSPRAGKPLVSSGHRRAWPWPRRRSRGLLATSPTSTQSSRRRRKTAQVLSGPVANLRTRWPN